MGIRKSEIQRIEKILRYMNLEYKDLIMAELGNQGIRWAPKGPAKIFFESKGVNHTSFDWNGKDGAVSLDLREKIPKKYRNKYNIITNFGTSEHVENQQMCFENINLMCKASGVMIHVVPLENNWKKHCNYHYTKDFFKKLSQKYNYKILENCIETNRRKGQYLVACSLEKLNDTII